MCRATSVNELFIVWKATRTTRHNIRGRFWWSRRHDIGKWLDLWKIAVSLKDLLLIPYDSSAAIRLDVTVYFSLLVYQVKVELLLFEHCVLLRPLWWKFQLVARNLIKHIEVLLHNSPSIDATWGCFDMNYSVCVPLWAHETLIGRIALDGRQVYFTIGCGGVWRNSLRPIICLLGVQFHAWLCKPLLRLAVEWNLIHTELPVASVSRCQRIFLKKASVHLWFLWKVSIASISYLTGLHESPLWNVLREDHRAWTNPVDFCLFVIKDAKSCTISMG